MTETMIERAAESARQAYHGRRVLPPWVITDHWERQKWIEAATAVIKEIDQALKETP